MATSFTEIFKTASPLRGGYPAAAMAGGLWGFDGVGRQSVSSTLSSVNIINLTIYGTQSSGAYSGGINITLISGGCFDLNAGYAASGSWLAFGF